VDPNGYSRLAIRLGRWMIVIGVLLLLVTVVLGWYLVVSSPNTN
jgi:hypothetical protein